MSQYTESRPSGSFVAVTDDCRVYTIHVTEEWVVSEHHDSRSERLNIRSFATEYGQPVNRMRKGEYRLLSGERLSATDPDEPDF